MNIDRRAFLAFATVIAAATSVACGAPDDTAKSDSADITSASGGGSCFKDAEVPFPYEEGTTCFDVYRKGIQHEYDYWSAVQASGKTRAEEKGCQPLGPSFDESSGVPLCTSDAAEFAYYRCHAFVENFKSPVAAAAVQCLTEVPDLIDAQAVLDCGSDALDRTCAFPTAEGACKRIDNALKENGQALSAAEMSTCKVQLKGLLSASQAEILERAAHGSWVSFDDAIAKLSSRVER